MGFDPELAAELSAEEEADLSEAFEEEAYYLSGLLFNTGPEHTQEITERIIRLEELLLEIKRHVYGL